MIAGEPPETFGKVTAAKRDQRALHDRRRTVFVESGNQRFTNLELSDRLFDVQLAVDAKGFGSGLDRPLIARCECAQRVLDAVAELASDLFRDVDRVLRDEIDADAFGTDQTNDLLDFFLKRLGCIIEEQVRFIEEEHQLGLFGIADLGKGLEQFGQQPQQEGGIKLRAAHQRIGSQHVDHAAPLIIHGQEVDDLQRGFAKELVRALAFEAEQLALDCADAGLGYITVFARHLAGVFVGEGEHRLQVAQVEQQQRVVIGIPEDDVEHAFLRVVEVEQPGEQQGAHFRNRGADGEALFPVKVPENRRIVGIGIIVHAKFFGAAFELVGVLELRRAGHGNPGKIAFDIGHEHGDAACRKAFRQTLQGHGFTGTRRPGDQTVAIGLCQPEILLFAIAAQPQKDVIHSRKTPCLLCWVMWRMGLRQVKQSLDMRCVCGKGCFYAGPRPFRTSR